MDYYAGIDVSLEASSVCLVDATGKIIRETKVVSGPDALGRLDNHLIHRTIAAIVTTAR